MPDPARRSRRLPAPAALPAVLRLVGRGLLLGMAVLGVLVTLAALRLSTGWGLLLVVASTLVGVLVLGLLALRRHAQVVRAGRSVARSAEAMLRQSRHTTDGPA